MNQPTHEEISHRAHRLWEDSGPAGGDATQNWLDAERELTRDAANVLASPAVAHPLSESHSAKATAERVALQKKEARHSQTATHTGPKSAPAESGKPLWQQPHSS